MIKSFACKETELISQGLVSKRIDPRIQSTALRKLRQLHQAHTLDDLRIPPSNRLERLKGTRSDTHSIRINRQWRITFHWSGDAENVKIEDYH